MVISRPDGSILMKYLHLVLISLIAACSGAGPTPTAHTPQAPERFTLGLVVPLTGDAGAFGENVRKGADLAATELNGAASGIEVVVKVEDSRGVAADAVAATRKLLDIDRVNVLIGDVTSEGTHALLPVAQTAGVAVISPAASDPSLSGVSQFFLRLWPSDVHESTVIAAHIASKGYRRVGLVYANTDYGVAMVKALRQKVAAESISLDVPLERETANYRPTIERLKAEKVDSLFLVLYPEDGERFFGQMRQAKLELPVMATSTIEDPRIPAAAAGMDLVFASPVPPDDADSVRAGFMNAFKSRYGESPGVLADIGYDATRLVASEHAAHPSAGGAELIASLRGINGYHGASGTMSFDQNGDVEKPYRLKHLVDGAFAWTDPTEK